MSDAGATKQGRPSHLRRLKRLIGRLAQRVYALALIVVIVWVSWLAFAYLVRALFIPAGPPERIVDLPKRLDVDVLRTSREDWHALMAAPHPRSPLSHYHRLDSWISPDIGNNCTTSGCHAPLPHAIHKETRAFLNMHSTVLHCGVCHMEAADASRSLVWYDIRNGHASPPPAVFQGVHALVALSARAAPADLDDRANIIAILRQAVTETGRHPQLEALVEQFRATRPGSEKWDSLVTMAVGALKTQFRGEYGRKLALRTLEDGSPVLGHPGTDEAVRRFLREEQTLSAEQREELLVQIHPLRRGRALTCTQCHSPNQELMALEELGFPADRINDLTGQIIFTMIENIAEGRPFYLPRFLDRRDEP